MNLEDKVYNLDHSVNELKVSVASIEATLSSVAKHSDLTNIKIDLDQLKTKFETTLPHLATKEEVTKSRNTIIYWLFGLFLIGNFANIFIPPYFINSFKTQTANQTSSQNPAK